MASRHVRRCQLSRDSDAAITTPIMSAPADFCAGDKHADKFLIFTLVKKCFLRVNTLGKLRALCGAGVTLTAYCLAV